ncbi:hypothetical protein Cgig2_025079 [Carnegiea gigantea]|uniref:Uncharacterized protein n=1 Tax=Carnegiea gigantea TaxID=171969 RepID=A0A9Q1KJQ1_9CARY|nr:hypothetical protein Cgig2_025079 [Carnegiea gigantea]
MAVRLELIKELLNWGKNQEEEIQPEPVQNEISPRFTSYASLVDPEEGIALKFIPLKAINGHSEFEYRYTAVICGVVGANPPVDVIDGFVHRIWENMSIDKALQARKEVLLVRFNNVEDKMAVIQRQIYCFNKKAFIVQFPKLDIRDRGIDNLSKIGSMLGVPIKTDRTTKEKYALYYAGIFIKMPLAGPLPETIDFINDWDLVVRQKVKYEWKPTECT